MSKPSHIACVVVEPKQAGYRKATWREAAAMWPHKNGTFSGADAFHRHARYKML